jgi:predicted ATP-grasp superfamily ATP-dependent carboligase
MAAGWSVVVTDGEQRSALATVRSLGRAGHTVHVCAARPASLAAASRYRASETVVPDPLRQPAAFASAVADAAARHRADVILPVTEPALLAILPDRDRFSAALPFPSMDRFEWICDKARVLEAAQKQGIAVPAQRVVGSREEALSGANARFPVVLKPSRSVVGPRGARAKVSVLYANDPVELECELRRLPLDAYPLLMQERITGPGTAISILLWDGELRAAFAHRRLREKPPSGGVSVLRESTALDADLLARSVALLRGVEWQGVAMVEYKVDARTGTPYLMEVNGRLWGSLQLAIDAGVDFPSLLVQAAMGTPALPVLEYDVGVRTRWEWGDVDHLLARMRRSRADLALADDAPGRMQTLHEFIRAFGRGNRSEVFRRDDPWPFLCESADWVRGR